MYLWQIEYNNTVRAWFYLIVVNRCKLCIFDRLNTTFHKKFCRIVLLWIALNYVSLTDWIQHVLCVYTFLCVVNRFKLCIFDRLNTTTFCYKIISIKLWIALNYVSLTDWIQLIGVNIAVERVLWIALNYVSLTDWIQLF